MFWLPIPLSDISHIQKGALPKPLLFPSFMEILLLLLAGEKQDFLLLSMIVAVSTVDSGKTIAAVPG